PADHQAGGGLSDLAHPHPAFHLLGAFNALVRPRRCNSLCRAADRGTALAPTASESADRAKELVVKHASSYRGARRNADRLKGWPNATFAKSRPLAPSKFIPLNRSKKWTTARSYRQAREMSPS